MKGGAARIGVDALEYDPAVLEKVAQRFRRDMWRSVVPAAVLESGVEMARFGPVQATVFGDLPQVTVLNQIQGAAEPGAVEGGHLAAAIEWMRAREVEYRIPVASCRPGAAQAQAWLSSRGYELGDGWLKLIRDTSAGGLPEAEGVAIYALGEDEADGEGLSTIAAEALDLPATAGTLFFALPQERPWRCYTAALAPGEPAVATGAMLIEAGVAQLGPGTTLPIARGRGCNTALLRRRILDAAAGGCHTVFVELCENRSTSGAYRNLRRAGFEVAYESQVWQRPALRPARVR
jgi:GNAT superfamily N-acetyltransferase